MSTFCKFYKFLSVTSGVHDRCDQLTLAQRPLSSGHSTDEVTEGQVSGPQNMRSSKVLHRFAKLLPNLFLIVIS